MSEEERELFNTMLKHHTKSYGVDTTEEDRDHHQAIYKKAKKDLWKLQDEKRKNDKNT